MYLLSVIVPVYNAEKYIRECIESIINQTYKNLELILVNDGSTDSSGEICDLYGRKEKKVSVFHQKNRGPLSARLRGLCHAKGDYVTFVDADDWIKSDTYEENMDFEGNIDVISFGIIRYFNETHFYEESRLENKIYDKKMINTQIIPTMLWNGKLNACGIDSSLCTKIFRKNLLKKHLEKAEKLNIYFGQDVAVTYPLLLEANTLINHSQCFYYHRQRKEGMEWPYFADEKFFDKAYQLYVFLRNEFKKSEFRISLQKQLDKYYRHSVNRKLNEYDNADRLNEYVFPYWMISPSAKVVLYGAGKIGKIYKKINDEYKFCRIVLWVDKASELTDGSDSPQSISRIEYMEYDVILIAVQSSFVAREIKEELMNKNVPSEKIIWRTVNVQALKEM